MCVCEREREKWGVGVAHSFPRTSPKVSVLGSLLAILKCFHRFEVRFVVDNKVLQLVHERLKGGAVHRFVLPAVTHHLVDGVRGPSRLGNTVAFFRHLLERLGIAKRRVGLLAFREELDEKNAKRPNIRLRAEAAIKRCFRRGPLDRELGAGASDVFRVDKPGEAEIGDFDDVVCANEDVPRRQVAVDELPRLKVRHALCNLKRHIDLEKGEGKCIMVRKTEK